MLFEDFRSVCFGWKKAEEDMYAFMNGLEIINQSQLDFRNRKRRVYDEKEGVSTLREALYSALSGDYVVPLRAKPKARKLIPWRSRVSFSDGCAMSLLDQHMATLLRARIPTMSKPAVSALGRS